MSKLPPAPTARTSWIAAEFTTEEYRLVSHWLSKREGSSTPRLAAFAPEDFRPWLANLQIHEASDGRYLCRVSGTEATKEKGYDVSGKHLDEVIAPEVYANAKPMFDRALASGRPLRYRGRTATAEGNWRGYRRMLLPVRRVAQACDTLLSLLSFEAAMLPTRARGTILGSWELTETDLRESFSAAA